MTNSSKVAMKIDDVYAWFMLDFRQPNPIPDAACAYVYTIRCFKLSCPDEKVWRTWNQKLRIEEPFETFLGNLSAAYGEHTPGFVKEGTFGYSVEGVPNEQLVESWRKYFAGIGFTVGPSEGIGDSTQEPEEFERKRSKAVDVLLYQTPVYD